MVRTPLWRRPGAARSTEGMRLLIRVLFAAALLTVVAAAPAQAAPRHYTAVDLGTLGGETSAAFAMNDAGQVVGISRTASGAGHAFLWSKGRMTDLGTLPGGGYSVAVDINERGLVVGNASDATGAQRAVAWDRGRIIVLGSLGEPGSAQVAAVNDRGQILGDSSGPDNIGHRVIWHRGAITDLGTYEGLSTTRDINNRGDVVGTYQATPGAYPCDCRAAIWRNGVRTDLGDLGSTGAWLKAYPMDISNRGVVVGASVTAQEEEHAFLWRDGVMRDLGTLGGPGSRAVAVNDRGAVVGFSQIADQVARPFLWRGGVMTDLTTRGLTAGDDLSDINDRGQMVGTRDSRAKLYR